MKYKTLKIAQLIPLLKEIEKAGNLLLVPKKKGHTTCFSEFNNSDEIDLNYIQTTISPKSVLFPKVEELLEFKKENDSVTVSEPNLKNGNLDKETVVFGIRPCDAAGLDYLSDFFLNENTDFAVRLRKENTTLIGLTCKNFDENCFCTSVGLSPAISKGADISFTEIENDNYFVEILTEKGEKLIDSFPTYFADSQNVEKEKFVANVQKKFNLDNLVLNIKDYYDSEKWLENSLACLGCGACAFVCPTCSCFDIQDESNPVCGVRLRCWDSCAFGIFTLHASGHNPRPVQSNRWRNRVLHKFDYSERNMNSLSCVGCGRCIRVCPAGMNIVEQILDLQEA